jgi:hypothetical protein
MDTERGNSSFKQYIGFAAAFRRYGVGAKHPQTATKSINIFQDFLYIMSLPVVKREKTWRFELHRLRIS